jgi:hypothetical protein
VQYYQLEAGDTARPVLSQLRVAGSKLEESLSLSPAYGSPLPGLLPDYFAGLMDFWLRIDEAGEFQFELYADDRVWMWVDGWRRHADGAPAISGAGQECSCQGTSMLFVEMKANKQYLQTSDCWRNETCSGCADHVLACLTSHDG